MKSKLFFAITIIFAFVSNSIAQQKELKFKNFSQEEGLPSNESYFVYRDSKNFIWIATDQGVVRYNGIKMERFNLPDNVVFKIREDSKGRIWFFSQTGQLAYFFNEVIYPFKYNDSILRNIRSILITDAYVNENDEILINSAGGVNYKIHTSGIIDKIDYYPENRNDSQIINITQINQDDFFARYMSYNLWEQYPLYINIITKRSQLHYKVPVSREYYQHYGCIHNKNFYFFAGKMLIRLNEDGSFITKQFPSDILCVQKTGDNIWVGLIKNGAVLINSGLEEIYNEPILKNKSVTSVVEDYEGGTWFSSLESGVYYLKNIHVYNITGDSNLTQPVFRMQNLNDSTLLFANALGLYKFSKNRDSLFFKYKNERVNDLFIDDNKNFYFAGKFDINNATTLLTKTQKVNDASIKNVIIIQSASEVVKFPDHRYLFYQGYELADLDFNKTPVLKVKKIFSNTSPGTFNIKASVLFSDAQKQVWVGTTTRLYKLNSTLDTITPFKEASALFQKGITCIRQMENGIYCIGLRFGGIVLMQDTSIIANITENNGILSNSIKYFLPLKDQLWVATAKGISVIQFQSYNPLKYTIANIGKNEGFYNLITYQLTLFQNNILAATSNGIYSIENPGKFLKKEALEIPFYITSISYYKGDTSGMRYISVPFNKNRIKIKYSAICFNSPEDLKYYYRLNTIDTSWQPITGTELLLENLSPGSYELDLKATIPNQFRISGVQKLKIIIEYPWWQNNWLRLGIVFLFGVIVFLFYKNSVNKIKNREKLKTIQNTKMVELEQTALRSQMNPHFIFNCLTSIQQLIVSGNAADANDHLVRFARLIRKTLELSAKPFIKISEEQDYLSEYLFLELLRTPGQFDFSIEMDAGIDINKTEIPNMMLQPVIENCIRHGIKHLENKKGSITISLKQKTAYILCEITDNGQGRNIDSNNSKSSFAEQKSYGLDIVRKRLALLSETERGDFFIRIIDLKNADGSASGTRVILHVPFKLTNT